jgi:transposase
MTRSHGWAPSGGRAVGFVPKNWGESLTLAAGLSPDGIVAPLILRGSMTGEAFERYVEQFVAPELRPGDIVFLDNLGAHKRASVRSTIEATGAKLVYLPPYSPDLSPIENAWSKVKALLRRAGARTARRLYGAIAHALRAVTPEDARGWFRHCGYSVP